MVALGTLQAGAEEQLRRVLHLGLLRVDLLEPSRWRALLDITGRSENLAHKTIVRLVVVKAFLNPVVKRHRGFQLCPVGSFVAKERRPFVREKLGVLLGPQQALDQSNSLVW